MINRELYAWEKTEIALPHGTLIGVTDIEYGDEVDTRHVHGKGGKPLGFSRGNYSAEGKLTLLREEYQRLLDYARAQGRPFYRLPPFPITVAYASEDQPMRTDKLFGCVFKKRDNSAGQNDESIKIPLEFLITEIKTDGVKAY
jgi:hypothetical protein